MVTFTALLLLQLAVHYYDTKAAIIIVSSHAISQHLAKTVITK